MFNKVLIFLVGILVGGFYSTWFPSTVPQYNTIIKIDTIFRDSIKYKIDTIMIKMDTIKSLYETKYAVIKNQSVDSDIKFFSDYISKYD